MKKKKSRREVVVGVSVLMLFLVGCKEEDLPPPPNIIPIPGPRLVLPSLDGGEMSEESFRGSWILLNFFARWSPGTVKEIPDLLALEEEFRGSGVRVVGVSVDGAAKPVLKGFVERMKIGYPVLVGSIETGNEFGGLESVPTTFIIDREWNVINRHTGQISREAIRRELQALLADEARQQAQRAVREAARKMP